MGKNVPRPQKLSHVKFKINVGEHTVHLYEDHNTKKWHYQITLKKPRAAGNPMPIRKRTVASSTKQTAQDSLHGAMGLAIMALNDLPF